MVQTQLLMSAHDEAEEKLDKLRMGLEERMLEIIKLNAVMKGPFTDQPLASAKLNNARESCDQHKRKSNVWRQAVQDTDEQLPEWLQGHH